MNRDEVEEIARENGGWFAIVAGIGILVLALISNVAHAGFFWDPCYVYGYSCAEGEAPPDDDDNTVKDE